MGHNDAGEAISGEENHLQYLFASLIRYEDVYGKPIRKVEDGEGK